MKLKMHRPVVVMNRLGASIIDMFLFLLCTVRLWHLQRETMVPSSIALILAWATIDTTLRLYLY